MSLPYTLGDQFIRLPTYKINCTAFPNQMVGRRLHCFRTLRSIPVHCTSRGHNRHSPYGLQPVNSIAGLSCTIRHLANHRHCLRGFAMEITLHNARITSPSRFYGDSYFSQRDPYGKRTRLTGLCSPLI